MPLISTPQQVVTVFQKKGSYYAVDENGIVICRDSRTACIQEAVNRVNSLGGGMVYIRRGTYLMKAPVILDNISNVIIKGDGRDATVLKPDPNSPAVGFKKDSSTPTYNLVFEDFTIDAGLYDATRYQIFGIYLWTHTYEVYIHRLKLLNFNNRIPIHTEKVTGWIVGNYIKSTIAADAIALAVADGGQVVVAGNEIYENRGGGISTGAYSGYLTVTNNIVDTERLCISLETFYGHIRRAVVANNSCIGNPQINPNSAFSINIGNEPNVALEEAVVVGNILKHGSIIVRGGIKVVIADNLVIDPMHTLAGILIDSVPKDYRPTIIVSGNQVYSSGTQQNAPPLGIHTEDITPGGYVSVKNNLVYGQFVVGISYAEARNLGVYYVDGIDVDNSIYGAQYPLYIYTGNIKFRKKRGTITADGGLTQYAIPHQLYATPTRIVVVPRSADAAQPFYVTADSTNIYINYRTAPPSGTNNVVLDWLAEV